MNGMVYVIGGFAHKDLHNEQPVTLNSVERFSVRAERQWSHLSSMNESRAFLSLVTFNSQYIYALGGMTDYDVLQNIEKYDTLTDEWTIMYFKLPMPLAKMGAVLCDWPEGIFIAGGMNQDFEPQSKCWFLKF